MRRLMTNAPSKDSDQPGHSQIPRLIGVFAVRTCHFVDFFMRRLNIPVRYPPACVQIFSHLQ